MLDNILCGIIIGMIFVFATIGPYFIYEQGKSISENLLNPFGKTRWHLTVAEQHQHYFTDWIGQIGGGELLSLIDFI